MIPTVEQAQCVSQSRGLSPRMCRQSISDRQARRKHVVANHRNDRNGPPRSRSHRRCRRCSPWWTPMSPPRQGPWSRWDRPRDPPLPRDCPRLPPSLPVDERDWGSMCRTRAAADRLVLVAACGGGSTPTTGPTIGGLGGSAAPGATTGPVPTLGLVLPTLPGGGPLKHPFRSSGGTMLRVANVYTNAADRATTSTSTAISTRRPASCSRRCRSAPRPTGSTRASSMIRAMRSCPSTSRERRATTTRSAARPRHSREPNGSRSSSARATTATRPGPSSRSGRPSSRTANVPAPHPADGRLGSVARRRDRPAGDAGQHGDVRLRRRGRHVPAERGPGCRWRRPAWGPGSQQSYIFPAGAHPVSTYLGQPDCKTKSPYPNVPVTLNAGQRAFLFYYSPEGKTLKSMLLPIGS